MSHCYKSRTTFPANECKVSPVMIMIFCGVPEFALLLFWYSMTGCQSVCYLSRVRPIMPANIDDLRKSAAPGCCSDPVSCHHDVYGQCKDCTVQYRPMNGVLSEVHQCMDSLQGSQAAFMCLPVSYLQCRKASYRSCSPNTVFPLYLWVSSSLQQPTMRWVFGYLHQAAAVNGMHLL